MDNDESQLAIVAGWLSFWFLSGSKTSASGSDFIKLKRLSGATDSKIQSGLGDKYN